MNNPPFKQYTKCTLIFTCWMYSFYHLSGAKQLVMWFTPATWTFICSWQL